MPDLLSNLHGFKICSWCLSLLRIRCLCLPVTKSSDILFVQIPLAANIWSSTTGNRTLPFNPVSVMNHHYIKCLHSLWASINTTTRWHRSPEPEHIKMDYSHKVGNSALRNAYVTVLVFQPVHVRFPFSRNQNYNYGVFRFPPLSVMFFDRPNEWLLESNTVPT